MQIPKGAGRNAALASIVIIMSEKDLTAALRLVQDMPDGNERYKALQEIAEKVWTYHSNRYSSKIGSQSEIKIKDVSRQLYLLTDDN